VIHEEEDVVGMTTMEEELEAPLITQVGLGSYISQTLIDEGPHMEDPHDEVCIDVTLVSLELLEDGPYEGMTKGSLPMQWKTLPWMTTMRPYALRQGTLIVTELVGEICDLMEEGANARDNGGT